MAPIWPWLGALLAALPVALAGHGDPIAQKYIVEFVDSTTVRHQRCPIIWMSLLILIH